jgi:ribosomal protein L40E
MAQKQCVECGSQLADTAKQCHRCGIRVMSPKRMLGVTAPNSKSSYFRSP